MAERGSSLRFAGVNRWSPLANPWQIVGALDDWLQLVWSAFNVHWQVNGALFVSLETVSGVSEDHWQMRGTLSFAGSCLWISRGSLAARGSSLRAAGTKSLESSCEPLADKKSSLRFAGAGLEFSHGHWQINGALFVLLEAVS